MESDKKTYKREVSFSIMAVEIMLIFWSAMSGDAERAEHLFNLAKFLMPFASGLLWFAFGADWWSKEMKPPSGGL